MEQLVEPHQDNNTTATMQDAPSTNAEMIEISASKEFTLDHVLFGK
jgi:hypothetical protein